jgi:hypothetical protein
VGPFFLSLCLCLCLVPCVGRGPASLGASLASRFSLLAYSQLPTTGVTGNNCQLEAARGWRHWELRAGREEKPVPVQQAASCKPSLRAPVCSWRALNRPGPLFFLAQLGTRGANKTKQKGLGYRAAEAEVARCSWHDWGAGGRGGGGGGGEITALPNGAGCGPGDTACLAWCISSSALIMGHRPHRTPHA